MIAMTGQTLALVPWVWLAVATMGALALYARIFPTLVREWIEIPSFSHGFAVPLIATYLVWARRARFRGAPAIPSAWGLPVLIAGLAMLVIGVRGDESFVARISLPVTLLGLTLLLAGPRFTGVVWVGVAYLLFMIPPPYETLKLIMYRSRLLDATVSTSLLGWLNVPVHREGVLLHLPDITLEVADDCSSIPAIAALMSLGVAYALTANRPPVVRGILISLTIPFAIFANIVRITSTAAAVYYVGPWTLRTLYHQFNGTVNFLLTFLFLLFLDHVVTKWLTHGRRR